MIKLIDIHKMASVFCQNLYLDFHQLTWKIIVLKLGNMIALTGLRIKKHGIAFNGILLHTADFTLMFALFTLMFEFTSIQVKICGKIMSERLFAIIFIVSENQLGF